ncbi:hypothetical protein GDO81_020124, partial [Engystomops pustulosus]
MHYPKSILGETSLPAMKMALRTISAKSRDQHPKQQISSDELHVSATMRSSIISLTIFCALSGTGFADLCLKCLAKNSDDCVGVPVDCPNSKGCVVVSEFYYVNGTIRHSVKKDCNPGLPCNYRPYVGNFRNKEIRLNIQCCNGNCCNRGGYS